MPLPLLHEAFQIPLLETPSSVFEHTDTISKLFLRNIIFPYDMRIIFVTSLIDLQDWVIIKCYFFHNFFLIMHNLL